MRRRTPSVINVCGGGTYDITPPFVVDDKGYVPGQNNGTWGNWGTLTGGTCAQRAGAQGGKCHNWTYTYNAATGSDCAGVPVVAPAVSCAWTTQAWKLAAGVVKTIAPGAGKIQLYAWGTGAVTFGGAGQPGVAVTLTATPTLISVPITVSYGATDNVFSITFASGNTGTVVNVDDIRWAL